jgi:hypothetical protein
LDQQASAEGLHTRKRYERNRGVLKAQIATDIVNGRLPARTLRKSNSANVSIGAKPSTWMPERTDLQTVWRESSAWKRRMNRDQSKIN